jgi:hypothetical protein
MYIEDKSGGLVGEARIGRVRFSKTGSTLYYGGKNFRSLEGRGSKANFYDVESGDHFWISGCKKRGSNQLYGREGFTFIDEDVREEFWNEIRDELERKSQTRI